MLSIGLLFTSFALSTLYLIGYRLPNQALHQYSPSLVEFLETFWGYLSRAFGPRFAASRHLWAAAMIAVLCTAILALTRTWRTSPSERPRVLGLLLFLASCLVLGAAIAWGRAAWGPEGGMPSRYATLAMPILCSVYFIAVLNRSAAGLRAQIFLFCLACLMFFLSLREGLDYARSFRELRAPVERLLHAGAPPFFIAEKYRPQLLGGFRTDDKEFLQSCLRMLHDASIGEFRLMRDDSDFQELPVAARNCSYDGAQVLFALGKPRRVTAMRLRCAYAGPTSENHVGILWRQSARNDLGVSEPKVYFLVSLRAPRVNLLVWVDDDIDQIVLMPRQLPADLRVEELVLIAPRSAPQTSTEARRRLATGSVTIPMDSQ
jgi:hypothetical protein